MNKEQKNKLSELLEAVKKTDNDKIHIEAENDGLWNGVGVIIFEKGEHQIVYYRNFELFSQTLEMISNEKVEILCEYIDNCLNENNYNLLIEGISEGSFGNNYDNQCHPNINDKLITTPTLLTKQDIGATNNYCIIHVITNIKNVVVCLTSL